MTSSLAVDETETAVNPGKVLTVRSAFVCLLADYLGQHSWRLNFSSRKSGVGECYTAADLVCAI